MTKNSFYVIDILKDTGSSETKDDVRRSLCHVTLPRPDEDRNKTVGYHGDDSDGEEVVVDCRRQVTETLSHCFMSSLSNIRDFSNNSSPLHNPQLGEGIDGRINEDEDENGMVSNNPNRIQRMNKNMESIAQVESYCQQNQDYKNIISSFMTQESPFYPKSSLFHPKLLASPPYPFAGGYHHHHHYQPRFITNPMHHNPYFHYQYRHYQQRRKRRILFNQLQIQQLEKIFRKQRYLSASERDQLSALIGLSPTQVKIWFQNHRYKTKKADRDRSKSITDRYVPSFHHHQNIENDRRKLYGDLQNAGSSKDAP